MHRNAISFIVLRFDERFQWFIIQFLRNPCEKVRMQFRLARAYDAKFLSDHYYAANICRKVHREIAVTRL